jgi:uncharacterized protein (DUF1501 family)
MSFDRRDFLRFGLGSAMASAIGLPLLARARAASGAGSAKRARACILLFMHGGPSQIDTFDPKPGRPTAAGVKGIGTKVSGMQFSELLPLLGRQAHRLAVVRSIVSTEGNHHRARHLMHTGYVPQGGLKHPSFGSITAAELGKGDLPGYVSINGPGAPAGFLGAAHGPFDVQDPGKPVKDLAPAPDVDDARFNDRLSLWRKLDDRFAATHAVPVVKNQRVVAEQAIRLMKTADRIAFDLGKETDATRKGYGEGRFALGCLMARRLVEAGVPFVEVNLPGWDTHQNNLPRVKVLTAELDRAMSALLDDLAARGMLDSTLIVWAGDFGRTPTVNEKGGRDHYPQVTPAVLAGGGVRGGQVIGATDADGVKVVSGQQTVPNLYASIAHALGIDPSEQRMSPVGRPIATVDNGTVFPGLF